ncbi:SGNH/GDSL hydrolase family protein [Mucilaginibacter gynuensis]|uniref:SGNH/GDSL hydrolase family protein n=1 Tax=Mucilaginibacter gynuensis TaxID=1302236 RepID=A0ABP8GH27_9SPHI
MKFYPSALFNVFIIAVTGLSSCKSDRNLPDGTPADKADFSRYIAIGNSLTAGSADKGLYLEGQQNSYPEILAAQMKTVGGGSFSTPFFSAGQENGSGYLLLKGLSTDGIPQLEEVKTNLAVRGEITIPGIGKVSLLTKYQGPLNNYGVPSIRLADVTSTGFGNVNEYFERLLPGNPPSNKISYMDFVTEKPFTFFTCWLGSNDVLQYAATGGASKELFPTDKANFDKLYNLVAEKLTSKGAKGVIATIPDITKSAFFTAFTYSSLLKRIQLSAPQIKDLYIQTGDTQVRAATPEDLFTLSLGAANVLGKLNAQGLPYGLHPGNPIENHFVLDKSEVVVVKEYTDAYNTTIKGVAKARNLALYDAFSDLNEAAGTEGITENGIKFTGAFITGNLFSLDGVHLTPRGYAHIANRIIKVINEKYQSNIPLTDVSKFRAIKTR